MPLTVICSPCAHPTHAQNESLADALKTTLNLNQGVTLTPTQFFVQSGHAGALFLRFGGMESGPIFSFLFFASFATCCSVCASNLTHKEIPYHNLPIELLTAYIHVTMREISNLGPAIWRWPHATLPALRSSPDTAFAALCGRCSLRPLLAAVTLL